MGSWVKLSLLARIVLPPYSESKDFTLAKTMEALRRRKLVLTAVAVFGVMLGWWWFGRFGGLDAVVSHHNLSMRLHAVVVDQNGVPVPRARLKLSLREWFVVPPLMFASRTRDQWVSCNDDGRVDYKAGQGDSVVVEEVVKGSTKLEMRHILGIRYEAGAVDRGEIPTKEKPLLVKVWVPQGMAPVLEWSPSLDIKSGMEIYADIIGGVVSTQYLASADVVIKVDLQKADASHPRKPPGWGVEKISVVALDGGVMETDDLFLYKAPSQGYTNRITRTQWKTFSPGTTDSWDVPFYVHLRGRYFGSLRVMLVSIPAYDSERGFAMQFETRFAVDGSNHLQNDPIALDRLGVIDRAELSRKSARNNRAP